MALGTFTDRMFSYESTIITLTVRYVKCKVVSTFLYSKVNQFEILLFAQVVFKIDMSSRATISILICLSAMQDELIKHRSVIMCIIEIRIIEILIFRNPIILLHSPPLGREMIQYKYNLGDLLIQHGLSYDS